MDDSTRGAWAKARAGLGTPDTLTLTILAPWGYEDGLRGAAMAIARHHGTGLRESDGPDGRMWMWVSDATIPLEETAELATDLLVFLAALNVKLLEASRRSGNPLPRITDRAWLFPAKGGAEIHQPIRYAREPLEGRGWEDLANVWQIHRRGWADCDDAVGAYIAERALAGEHCTPTVYLRPNGVIHAQVRLENGRIVDPARSLGM